MAGQLHWVQVWLFKDIDGYEIVLPKTVIILNAGRSR